jgi:hydroxymethylglutaryl-CoA reductase
MVENSGLQGELDVLMSILSNYTPECLVECYVEGDISIFEDLSEDLSAEQFARKFQKAVHVAQYDAYRAVTHNKGIFNGMDAVILATGNDFRAVEACGHAYAARRGLYSGLSRVELSRNLFRFTLEVPLSVGTVGGLTGTHPLAAASLEILGNPSAGELMQVVAAAGMANNFAAIRSLVTSGIQKGHMKMHLGNILRQLNATGDEQEKAIQHFTARTISFSEVANYLEFLRNQKPEK